MFFFAPQIRYTNNILAPNATCYPHEPLLNPKARAFMVKKKLFLIKEVPRTLEQLVASTVNQQTPFKLHTLQTKRWAHTYKQLLNGWLQRLKSKLTIYQVKSSQRYTSYNHKKNFHPTNLINRDRLRKLFFPSFTPSKLTKFFIQTKASSKKDLCGAMLTNELLHPRELHWVISHHALHYFRDVWLFASGSAQNAGWSSAARLQIPLSPFVVKFLVMLINGNQGGWRGARPGLSPWTHAEQTLKHDKWQYYSHLGAEPTYTRIPSMRAHHQQHTQVSDDYRPNTTFGKHYWNQHISTNNRVYRASDLNPKLRPVYNLPDNAVYDYRLLHTLTYRPAIKKQTTPTQLADINMLNFRVFNWGIIT